MIDGMDGLSISKQAQFLSISRSSVYNKAEPVSKPDLLLMRRIDQLHLDYPFAGSRMLQSFLVREGFEIGRLRVRTLMKRMGIEAIYCRPNTSKPAQGHKIYPYLLRNSVVDRPNQVWAMDITFIPMARGFVYLAAVVDWFSRKVLSWRLSITLETEFCLEAVEEALAHYGKPEIFNTDQGNQFTSIASTGRPTKHDIKISMNGKGSWRDNVFVERLWRTIKYEEVYLRAYNNAPDSIVYSDSWRGYNVLDVSDFKDYRINHSETFADAKNHINGIENFLNQAKQHLRKFNGVPKAHFGLFLKECEWCFNNSRPRSQLAVLKQWLKMHLR